MKRFFAAALGILAFWVFADLPSMAQTVPKTAEILSLKGGIGPASQDFIERGLKRAAQQNAQIVVIELDTPGGLSTSMRGIIQAILTSPVPVATYVFPSGARAASAGTYILYASHIAAMAPGTNLGAATPVSLGGPGGGGAEEEKKKSKPSASELKALNDARAYIRGLAQLRGRNIQWAEQAVTEGESLSAREALKLNVIDVIAKDVSELLSKIKGRVVLVRGQEVTLNTDNLVLQRIEPDWRTRFLSIITDPSVAYILLMAGFYGLFFEFANPGFIIPGVVGGICLLLALYAFQLLPINYAGLALIVLGVIFIVTEAFLPSFGALGIGGVISFVIGSILLIRTDSATFGIPWQLIAGIAGVTLLFFLGVLQLAFRAQHRQVVTGAEGMVGKRGEIVFRNGQLRVKIAGEYWKIEETSQQWTEGQIVVVEAVEGLTLRVKKV